MQDRLPTRNEKQTAWRIIDEQAIILSLKDHQIRSLNPVGTRIWQLADGKTSVAQIAQAISKEYEISKNDAEQDVEDFINILVQKEISYWTTPPLNSP